MVRIWSKPDTQAFIKRLKDAGYTVEKTSSGYKCEHGGKVVFRALNGSRNYACTIDNALVTEAA